MLRGGAGRDRFLTNNDGDQVVDPDAGRHGDAAADAEHAAAGLAAADRRRPGARVTAPTSGSDPHRVNPRAGKHGHATEPGPRQEEDQEEEADGQEEGRRPRRRPRPRRRRPRRRRRRPRRRQRPRRSRGQEEEAKEKKKGSSREMRLIALRRGRCWCGQAAPAQAAGLDDPARTVAAALRRRDLGLPVGQQRVLAAAHGALHDERALGHAASGSSWEEFGLRPTSARRTGFADFRHTDAGLVNIELPVHAGAAAVPGPVRERDALRQHARGHAAS